MSGSLFHSLRVRLVLIVLLSLAPAFGLIFYGASEDRRKETAAAQDNALRLARLAAGNHERLIAEARIFLMTIAGLPQVLDRDEKACNPLFPQLRKRFLCCLNLGAADPEGNVFCSAVPHDWSVNIADRSYFQNALAKRDLAVSEYLIGRITGKGAVVMAYPAIDAADEVHAVVFAAVGLEWINDMAARSGLPEGSVFTVRDENGTILARYPDSEKWVGKVMPETPAAMAILSRKEGTIEAAGSDGMVRLYGFTPLRGVGERSAYVSVGIPREIVFADVDRAQSRRLVGMGVVGLLIIVAIWVSTNLFLMRQMRALTRAAKRLAGGDLSARTGRPHTPGEIGRLAHAFDEMARMLEVRDARMRESEARYRTLVEQIPAVTYSTHLDDAATMVYVSPRMETLLGYSQDEWLAAPHLWAAQIHPDDRERVLEGMKKRKMLREASHYEYRMFTRNGRVLWFHDEVHVVSDEAGEPLFLQGILLNITARKDAEEQLRWESAVNAVLSELYAPLMIPANGIKKIADTILNHAVSLTESAYGYVSTIDPASGRNMVYSLSVELQDQCRLTDGSESIVLPSGETGSVGRLPAHAPETGKAFFINSPRDCPSFSGQPEGHAPIRRFLAAPVLLGEEVVGQIALANKSEDYTERDVDAIQRIADYYALAIQRMRTRTALRESEARFRSAFEYASAGMALVGMDGRFLKVNRTLCEILGYTEAELLEKTWMDVIYPEDMSTYVSILRKIGGGTQEGTQNEMRYRGRTSPDLWFLTSASLVRDAENEPLYLIVHFQDVSKRRLAEAEKEILETQLRQAQKVEAIGTLAGGIAHDFNNILAAIIGHAEIMLGNVSDLDPIHRDLEGVLKASYRARDLVKQILTFSRMRGKQEKESAELGPIVEDAVRMISASLPVAVEIRRSIPSAGAFVLADPAQIRQILVNLCSNAVHAMNEKRGLIEIGVKEVHLGPDVLVAAPGMAPGPYVRLRVRDTGHGIDSAAMERIFDPYFTTKAVGQGSGLGLAVVQGIVKRHEGVITVRSKLGEGATFDIYFPKAGRISETGKPRPDQPIPGGTERILFVDDEEPIVEMCKRMLEQLGYQVAGAGNPVEALELFRSGPERFDLVITDYSMPHMTGGELAGALFEIRPDIAVILCTGYTETVSGGGTGVPGVRECISKPVNRRQMAIAIRKVLDERSGTS